jgi:rRNA maturation endonuclease Nob1
MTKYITNVKGSITGVVQGDGATVIIQDGKVTTIGKERLVKCRSCKRKVPAAPFCSACGGRL